MERRNVRSIVRLRVAGWGRSVAERLLRYLGGVPLRELEAARARIAKLEAQGVRTAPKKPAFVKANRPPSPQGEPCKKREQNFARPRQTPTRQVDHAYDRCPTCGTTLLGGYVKWSRRVLHVPIVPAEVIEHWFIARR